ncbi:Ig-like domain-containing protein, partial [bacterium]|nr:Ig-like domain-containing protein [bacterium]
MHRRLLKVVPVLVVVWFQYIAAQNITPVNFKMAFIGDQGINKDAKAVLQLILDEGTQAVMHAGDFDYTSNPSGWEGQINDILGANFPYFACMGEDDSNKFFSSNGYQARLEARMGRLGLTWDGDLGVQSSFQYQGIFFVQTAAGVEGEGHADYIEDKLAATSAIWRISTFHKTQRKMQLCGHGDATGWGVYERSREGGAIITTGQCHVYARTYLLSDMSTQEIVSTSDTLVLSQDLSGTAADEGRTFAVVSGLGGRTLHDQDDGWSWMAAKYSRKQNSQFGALFGVFNYNGVPNLARFYFKNIDGDIIDEFYVTTAVDGDFGLTVHTVGAGTVNGSPQGPVYDDGTQVTLTATPSPGWEFTGWSGDLSGAQNPISLTMDDHKVVTAIFTELPPPEYTLTLSTQGAGTVTVDPPGNVFVEGTIITLTATPDPGFTLSGWSGDADSPASPLSLTMDADKTIIANFVENAVPLVIADQYTMDEDLVLSIPAPGILANDSDPDSDPLLTSMLVSPVNGSLTLGADGSFTYTPNANFNGEDSFTYLAADGRGGNASATVDITVSAVNDSPTTQDETFRAILGKSITVATPGVLLNDSDIESNILTATLLAAPSNGSVVLNADGSFYYTASANILGTDTFTYLAHDSDGASSIGTVTVEVNRGEIVHEQTVGGGSTDAFSVSTDGIIHGVSGELYIAAISTKRFRIVSTISGLGLIWTRADMQCSGRDQTGVEVWMARGTPTMGDIVTASFADNPSSAVIAVSRYSGVDPNSPIGGVSSGNTNGLGNDCSGGTDSDSYSLPLTTTGASSVVYGAAALRNKAHNPGTGFSERGEISRGTGGSAAGIAVSDKPVALVSTVSMTGSFDNNVDWAFVGLEIRSSKPQFAVNLTQNGLGDASLNPPGGVYDEGTSVTLTAIAAPEWTFGAWSGDLISSSEAISFTMDADKNLTATFEPPEYSLNILATGGLVTINPPGNIHVLDTEVTLTAIPDTGRTFSGWSGDTTSIENPLNLTMDSNKSITATFPVNDSPTVTADFYSLNEDDTLSVEAPGLLINDIDPDQDPLILSLVDDVENGLLTLNSDGSFSYIPNSHFNGSDTLSYVAQDGKGGVDAGLVVLTIQPINDAPVAAADQFQVNEDDTLVVVVPGVLANDADLDGDPIISELIAGSINGKMELTANGSFTYTPNADFNGTETFDYQVSDPGGSADTATVTITVNPQNDLPVAANDAYELTEDDTLSLSAPGLLANDTDIDGDGIVATVVDSTLNGELTLNADGGFTYRPRSNFHGVDSFTYRIDDGNGGSSLAAVSLTVNEENDAPIAVPDLFAVSEDDTLDVLKPGVLGNDSDIEGDSLSVSGSETPANGSLVLDPDGSFVYIPHPNFNGADTLAYTISDGNGGQATAHLILNVNPLNDAPVAADDLFDVVEDDTLRVVSPGVLANDTDGESDPLTATLLGSPTKGSITLNSVGDFVYSPAPDSNGLDHFTYLLSDGNGGSDTASVMITVHAINDPPVAVDDSYSVPEDDSLIVAAPGIIANDIEIDGDGLFVSIENGPSHGSLLLNADGSFRYIPEHDYNGSDLFTYLLADGQGGTSIGTVSLDVTFTNDVPVSLDDSFTIDEDDTLIIVQPGLLANDSDPDGQALSASVEIAPINGSVTVHPNGSFAYSPAPHFN